MQADGEKWDARYRESRETCPHPDPLLTQYEWLLEGGLALDLASGLGRNALFLAAGGFETQALDISRIALQRLRHEARSRGLDISSAVVDLDMFPLPHARYDVVMVFSFFSKSLAASISQSLKPGGMLFSSTFNHRHVSVKPGFNPAYLVPLGGLAPVFPDLDVLLHEPYWGPDRNIARLIARSPSGMHPNHSGVSR